MPAQILDGKIIAAEIRAELKDRIKHSVEAGNRPPELAVILIGEDAASALYVSNKHRACAEIGIISHNYTLSTSTDEATLLALIDQLNANPAIDGILVQLPLPVTMDTHQIVERILPHKDVDGFHPYNLGRLGQRRPFLRPSTPAGIIELLQKKDISLEGLHATVVGVSNIVGRPMILELLMKGCTVTACHRLTQNLKEHIKQADVVIAALGNPHFIKGDWIKPGAIVIDVGINRLANGQWVGDVEFESAATHASWITPVPGGVGPMTVAFLLQNTVTAYKIHIGENK
jgi:methylenetetrahydrofolate dehydrogenase (NADP+)/methenyltetrahydrofolate cyclohydrolase